MAQHERCYGRQQEILELEHYLDVLEHKPGAQAGSTGREHWPGALAGSKPLEQWRLVRLCSSIAVFGRNPPRFPLN